MTPDSSNNNWTKRCPTLTSHRKFTNNNKSNNKQLQSIVVRAQITNIAALLPRNYFHRCSCLSLYLSLSLCLCACEWQTFCTMTTKRTASKAEQAEKERERKRVSKATASNRCTSRKWHENVFKLNTLTTMTLALTEALTQVALAGRL